MQINHIGINSAKIIDIKSMHRTQDTTYFAHYYEVDGCDFAGNPVKFKTPRSDQIMLKLSPEIEALFHHNSLGNQDYMKPAERLVFFGITVHYDKADLPFYGYYITSFQKMVELGLAKTKLKIIETVKAM